MDANQKPSAGAFPFWWAWPSAASDLSQPILPGWSFGNVTVNAENSSAPQTELDIVAAESYGRQIGKLLDAVVALIAERGASGAQPEAFAELLALRQHVETIKTQSAQRRLSQVRQDLQRLKDHDPTAYDHEVAALRQILSGNGGR